MNVVSNAALYGKGVFTTISIREGLPFLWEKHWRRLNENASKVGIDLSEHSENGTQSELMAALDRDRITDGRARITFHDERRSVIWPGENASEQMTTLSIVTGPRRDVPDNFKLTISPFPINSLSPTAGVKSCNYLEQIMSLDEAKGRGFHEGVRSNERGEIASACMANVFWLKDGRLFTPSLETGCLAGTTRELVLENLDCEEVSRGVVELNEADAIFLTSAGLGVVRVGQFDGRDLTAIGHPIERLI